jgi:hypothetical protein
MAIETSGLVIIHECCRSIHGTRRQVHDYFDAFIVGRTAAQSLIRHRSDGRVISMSITVPTRCSVTGDKPCAVRRAWFCHSRGTQMLGWLMLVLVLLIVLAWDSSAKWAALQRSVEALTIRLDDMEEQHREAQEQRSRDGEAMQKSTWRLACRVAALQHRVEALTARLDMIEEPVGDNPKVRTAVREFMSSFEHSAAEPPPLKPPAKTGAQFGLHKVLTAAASRTDRVRPTA